MDENSKNAQALEQQDTQQTQGDAGQQSGQDGAQQQEKLFTQADVDRIINNRLARMKQDMDTADTYRRERDDARRELEKYKNDAFLKEKGVSEQYKGYVNFEAVKLVDDNTSFQQAVEKFLKENPFYAGRGYRVVSTSSSNMNHGSGANIDTEIRRAMGLK